MSTMLELLSISQHFHMIAFKAEAIRLRVYIKSKALALPRNNIKRKENSSLSRKGLNIKARFTGDDKLRTDLLKLNSKFPVHIFKV